MVPRLDAVPSPSKNPDKNEQIISFEQENNLFGIYFSLAFLVISNPKYFMKSTNATL